MIEKPTSVWRLVLVGTLLPVACLVVLGAFVACATGPTLQPLPPLPGPGFNDWTARATDGGVRG